MCKSVCLCTNKQGPVRASSTLKGQGQRQLVTLDGSVTTTQSNLYPTINDFVTRMFGVLDALKDYWSSFWTRPAIIESDRTISSNHDHEEWNARQGGEAIVGPNMEGGGTIILQVASSACDLRPLWREPGRMRVPRYRPKSLESSPGDMGYFISKPRTDLSRSILFALVPEAE